MLSVKSYYIPLSLCLKFREIKSHRLLEMKGPWGNPVYYFLFIPILLIIRDKLENFKDLPCLSTPLNSQSS